MHGHWTLVRLLRVRPDLPEAAAARALLDRHLAAAPLAAELEYLRAKRNRTFERPYGWGWLLRLAAEVHALPGPEGQRWDGGAGAARRVRGPGLRGLPGPTQHAGARRHSRQHRLCACPRPRLRPHGRQPQPCSGISSSASRELFGADRDCPTHFEPSGEDFISPCLVEADLLRRVLPAGAFARWLERFLPAPGSPRFAPLAAPPEVRDLKDYRIGHLIGLSLQRAASFDGIASALPAGDTRRTSFRDLATKHERAALQQLEASGYGGAHWLASFVVYHLTRAGVPAQP